MRAPSATILAAKLMNQNQLGSWNILRRAQFSTTDIFAKGREPNLLSVLSTGLLLIYFNSKLYIIRSILNEPLFLIEKEVAFTLIQRCVLCTKERKAGAASMVAPGQY